MSKERISIPFIFFLLFAVAFLNQGNALADESETGCIDCHDDFDQKSFSESVHQDLACDDCHADLADPTAHSNGDQAPKPVDCSQCHEADKYALPGHDAAKVKGNKDAPGCVFCHGSHRVKRTASTDPGHDAKLRNRFTGLCIKCHGDKEMMERNKLTTSAVDSFENTYHGQLRYLGYTSHVAGCADCHTGHNILPSTDSNSILHPDHMVGQCGKCHRGSNEKFVKFCSHPEYLNREKNPILFWTVVVMTTVLGANLLLFGLHTGLWWRKSYWEAIKSRRQKKQDENCCDPHQCFTRFSFLDRIMHLALAVSFFGLVITGIPLLFHRASWAKALMNLLGGAETAGLIHRAMAIVQIVLFAIAAVLIIRFFIRKKAGVSLASHPDSVFFIKKDWHDFKGMMKWFVGLGKKPEFERWTYWEKADIFAFFWGMFTIGLSGLILWFPEIVSKSLPGWIFNVATIIHSFEAMLATIVIFTAHFFNTHLLPNKFPLDLVIFTGRVRRHEFIEERPLYYKRLEKEGMLTEKQSSPPSAKIDLLYKIFGVCSLMLGFALTVMIVIGFFSM